MSGKIAAVVTIMLGSMVAARAADPPVPLLKEGLWESHTQSVIGKEKFVSVMKLCRTHAFDKSVRDTSKAAGENLRKRDLCGEAVISPTAGGYTSVTRCEKDKSVTTQTMTFQADTAYRLEQHRKIGGDDTVTIIEDHYVGSCPADMKPGDMLTPDGKKMNFGAM